MSNAVAAADLFTAEELAEWTPLLEAAMKEQVSRRNIVASGALLRSMVARMLSIKEVQLEFLGHGRFHDMGAHEGWRKGQYVGKSRIELVKRPKPSLFYSRTKMGMFGQLVENLSGKYVETLYQQAVQEMKQGTQ